LGSSEGGGEERVIENGAVFEKGGVNILLFMEIAPTACKSYLMWADFFCLRTEFGLHPKSPMVPVHANWRYFEMYDEKEM
jgi:coproporphyrinogen III oxidase